LTGESDDTSRLSREHAVAVPVPGLVTVAGGKYTTYRVMALDAVDTAARGLDAAVPASVTDLTPLLGAEGFQALWNRRYALAAESGLHVARIEHLLGRYGTLVHELLDLLSGHSELAEPLPGADDYLAVEALYAATHEGALHVDDVLARRTRISIESWDRGEAAAEAVARLLGEIHGWSEEQIDHEVALYHARVKAERLSQEQQDDRAADAARLMAPDALAGSQGEGAAVVHAER
jgi:glycerol-3-phosphate dehydrogenase